MPGSRGRWRWRCYWRGGCDGTERSVRVDECQTIQAALNVVYGAVLLDSVVLNVTRGINREGDARNTERVSLLDLTFCSISCFGQYLTARCQAVVTRTVSEAEGPEPREDERFIEVGR